MPIYSALLEGFTERREELLRDLTAMSRTVPSHNVTNRNSWHSAPELHLGGHPASVRWAVATIEHIAATALADLYDGFRTLEPRVVESWAVVGGTGAWHTAHNHYPRAWSGVLYVSAEQCAAADTNDRSGKIEFLNPLSVAPAFYSAGSVAYAPKDGLLLLFPGALQHMVHPNATPNERAVISFNLDIARRARVAS